VTTVGTTTAIRRSTGEWTAQAIPRLRGRRRNRAPRAVPRERVLTAAELDELLAVGRADFPRVFPLVLFLADTGCRIGEAIGLRWTDVDLEAGIARIERSIDHLGRTGPTKTKRACVVELSTRLHEVLAERRPDLFGEGASRSRTLRATRLTRAISRGVTWLGSSGARSAGGATSRPTISATRGPRNTSRREPQSSGFRRGVVGRRRRCCSTPTGTSCRPPTGS
jgi:integrase